MSFRHELWVTYVFVFLLLGGALFALFLIGGNLTGFAVFDQNAQGDFDNGIYYNTEWNGSAVVLSGNNLSGAYTSEVFDAGADSMWNNLTYSGGNPNVEFLFAVDGAGDVYESTNDAVTWTQAVDNYGRTSATTDMFADGSYLYILSSSGNEVWRSQNSSGTSFSVINNSFGASPLISAVGPNNELYVVVGNGNVYKSTDMGVTWSNPGDINPGTQTPKGITVLSNGNLYAVDGTGAVYESTNDAVTWTEVNSGYGGSTATDAMKSDSSGNIYILINTDVYKSTDNGVTWNMINDSISPYANTLVEMGIDSSDNLYVLDAVGRVFESTDSGITWNEVGDMNAGASNNPYGFTNFIQPTNLSFEVRNCSSSDCSDGIWQSVDLANINLQSQYFQYRVNFTSPDSSSTSFVNSISLDYSLVNTAPSLNLVIPQDSGSYGVNETIYFNFTVSDADDNLDSCFYSLDGASNVSLSGCANTTLSLNAGSYSLVLYANDSLGLLSSSSASFSVTNQAPVLSLALPQGGDTYGYNESIALNFTVFDSDGNLDSCWYNIDGGSNFTITNCANTTFDVSGSGDYFLYIYANDTLGEIASDSVSLSVSLGAPSISLSYPVSIYLSSGENTYFNYTPTDIDLDVCQLFGNFTGSWNSNQTDFSPTSASQNSFLLNLSDGLYKWNIMCNDSVGNFAFNGNKTFTIDTINPVSSISEPNGIKTSRTGISLEFSANDSNRDTCWYNVERGGITELSNTTISCFVSTTFDVTVDADFVLNFFVNDSAGNLNSTSHNFTVDTSTTTVVNSGGGGGSPGGGSIVINKPSLSVGKISDVTVTNGGVKKIFSLSSTNTGNSFLNDCKFESVGQYKDWTTYTETKGLAAGETYEFVFDVNIPEDVSEGGHEIQVSLICEEANASTTFNIDILGKQLDFELLNVERIDKGNVSVSYRVKDLLGKDQSVQLQFLIFGLDNKKEAETNEIKLISAGSDNEFETIVPIREDLEGELSLLVNLNSESYSSFVQENIVLGGSISGFSIFGGDGAKNNIVSLVIVLLFLVFAFFMVKRIRGHHRTIKGKR